MSRRLRLPLLAVSRQDGTIVAALLFFAAALWLPPLTLQRPSYSYLVTFDLTQSMDVPDMLRDGKPISRLEAARDAMRALLPRLPCGSRLGWAIFADYRSMPLMLPVEACSHYDDLLTSLERIDGRMRWANASNVGKGVTWSVRTANKVGDGTRVLFFTDGQEAPPLRDSVLAMADIRPGEVGGWLVGVGGDVPQRIPKTARDGRAAGYWTAEEVVQRPGVLAGQGQEHLSRLDGENLLSISKQVGFGYHRLVNNRAFADAVLDPAAARLQPTPTDLRWIPALLGLLMLAWRFLPPLPAHGPWLPKPRAWRR